MTKQPVANLNSTGSHGGGFVPAQPPATGSAETGTFGFGTTQFNGLGKRGALAGNLNDNGIRVLRVGDVYACPIHGPNPVTTGSALWKDNGRQIVRLGDSTACGATVTAPVSPEWSSE